MKKLIAEALGTGSITLAVIGSGFMATNLTNDVALQLVVNCIATVAMLYFVITAFHRISGSHFNPMVSILILSKKDLGLLVGYLVAQIIGATAGAILANLMFDQPLIELSNLSREGNNLLIGEFIAASGLLFIIFLKGKAIKNVRPLLISLWIASAYFFTASTSFANPVITYGRMLSDSFAGISPQSALAFISIQVFGSLAGYALAQAMNRK
jgi:glycerol uptake facilitator-like aquaporin